MMNSKPLSKTAAILLALLVTFLWSTSFIIIKFGLAEIPPILFAGLRYSIAFACLLPLALSKERISEIKTLSKKNWIKLTSLGILFYTLTQGVQFIGLSLLPSVTVSLILNFTPIFVAFIGIIAINEIPTRQQWFGVFLFLIGVLTYFLPTNLSSSKLLGIVVMVFGVVVNAGSAVLGRSINKNSNLHPVTITVISMGIGAAILLITGVSIHGFPHIGSKIILSLIWLASINTAFAFTIWNFTQRTLSAMESSIINGTMLIQIALLAWIFLGEEITLKESAGMLIAAAGAFLVQVKKSNK